MRRSTLVLLTFAIVGPATAMGMRSSAQVLPKVEWLGCIETFTRKPTLSMEYYPDAIVLGLVSRCPKQVVGLLCVEDAITRRWSAYHNAGRRVDPQGTLQETIPGSVEVCQSQHPCML
jgi:hypothetical protein